MIKDIKGRDQHKENCVYKEENEEENEQIVEISEKRLGVTAVIENKKIVGIITDGDIRRMLNKTETIAGVFAKDIMTVNAKTVQSVDLAREAMKLMEQFSITQLVVSDGGVYKGILHLHDILKEGIV